METINNKIETESSSETLTESTSYTLYTNNFEQKMAAICARILISVGYLGPIGQTYTWEKSFLEQVVEAIEAGSDLVGKTFSVMAATVAAYYITNYEEINESLYELLGSDAGNSTFYMS